MAKNSSVQIKEQPKTIDLAKYLVYLGYEVEDKVTKFRGVVSSVGFDLYGCVQAIINPGMDKDGKLRDSVWFDIERLNVIGEKPIMVPPNFKFMHGPAERPALNKA